MRAGLLETAMLVLVIAAGVAVVGLGARNVWRGRASSEWPTVRGVVVRSATDTTITRDSRTRATSRTTGAIVVVRYRAGGGDHETSTLHFGQTLGSTDPSDAEVRRRRYPLGDTVTVRHHPTDPALATIEPGVTAEAFLLPGAGVAFAAVGLMALALYRSAASGPTGGGGMRVGLTMFGLIFCAIGVAMLAPGVLALWRGQSSMRWPAAAGTIVMGRPRLDPAASADSADSANAGSLIEAGRLVYGYDAAGRRRYGNTRTFGQASTGAGTERSEGIAARYPLGAPVTVRYASDRPDLSVLEPGIARESLLLPGAGLAFLAFGLAVLRWGVPALAG